MHFVICIHYCLIFILSTRLLYHIWLNPKNALMCHCSAIARPFHQIIWGCSNIIHGCWLVICDLQYYSWFHDLILFILLLFSLYQAIWLNQLCWKHNFSVKHFWARLIFYQECRHLFVIIILRNQILVAYLILFSWWLFQIY